VHLYILIGVVKESLCVAITYSALLIVGLALAAVQGCVQAVPWPHPFWYAVGWVVIVVLVAIPYTIDLIKFREDERDVEYRQGGWLLNKPNKKKYTDL